MYLRNVISYLLLVVGFFTIATAASAVEFSKRDSWNCNGSSSCTLTGAVVANKAINRYADSVNYTPPTSRVEKIASGPLGYTAIYRCDNGISVTRSGAAIKDGFSKLRRHCAVCGTYDFGDGCHATVNYCGSCHDTN